jgi:hypothetical protein
MRPSVRRNDRLPPIREEDGAGTAQIGEQRAKGGNQGDSCVDAAVFYAGAVGEGEGEVEGRKGGGSVMG